MNTEKKLNRLEKFNKGLFATSNTLFPCSTSNIEPSLSSTLIITNLLSAFLEFFVPKCSVPFGTKKLPKTIKNNL